MLIRIELDGTVRQVPSGISLAAVLAGLPGRRSASGEPRAALCGMGVCFECRVTVDGQPHQRACQLPVREGMVVQRDV
ncbi:(2Fe-2S)-binding protein [Chitinimonas sp. BJB300]|uniref:(2Fe-2S)-binding protein n=1 Tax=Chitinimonas sp. BJB300 TaxID=1559339 RepID=UPI000C0DC03E|nr:(2Fe-2S)-binding protein [Chitinimonas sp. BJB300]PHV12596.1 (2Fe-2S)-binding protein [Chitinimonas sp. BJB300]TSJ89914.1 (2Fe-2S)-binding protein [Chitinimonas sp. BJB300]